MNGAVRWVVAHPCESVPIREAWSLRAVKVPTPFPIFCSDDETHWLVVSGVGRTNAAAATMALHLISGALPHAVWLNLGIAGHRDLDIGAVRTVHKIIDAATGRAMFPIEVVKPVFEGITLRTVDVPTQTPRDDCVIDMEGAAVFQVASRLSSAERVALVKVVSDHGARSGAFPGKSFVTRLIAQHVARVGVLVQRLTTISEEECDRLAAPPYFEHLVKHFHLSATARLQLRGLLRRHAILSSPDEMSALADEAKDGRQLLGQLKAGLVGKTIDWRRQ
ncbi:MAG: hypothetical protein VX589_16410 [Myxococcota bacterium]|nr:hypothetical protein [Myxococcota bacterium]